MFFLNTGQDINLFHTNFLSSFQFQFFNQIKEHNKLMNPFVNDQQLWLNGWYLNCTFLCLSFISHFIQHYSFILMWDLGLTVWKPSTAGVSRLSPGPWSCSDPPTHPQAECPEETPSGPSAPALAETNRPPIAETKHFIFFQVLKRF